MWSPHLSFDISKCIETKHIAGSYLGQGLVVYLDQIEQMPIEGMGNFSIYAEASWESFDIALRNGFEGKAQWRMQAKEYVSPPHYWLNKT